MGSRAALTTAAARATALLGGLCLTLVLSACSRSASEADQIKSAQELIAKNDLRGATIQLKNALQTNPQSAQARLLLGTTLLESGEPATALVELLKAQELQVPDEQVVPDLARAMLSTGEGAKLIAQYDKLTLKDEAANASLKASLAVAYILQGNVPQARQAVAQALQARPGFPAALVVQARLLAADRNFDEAMKVLDDVLAREPGNERAALFKGDLQRNVGTNPGAAQDTYRKLLAAKPDSAPVRAALVGLMIQQRQTPQAKTEFAELKKAAPNNPETIFLEAQIAFYDGNYKLTRELTDRLLKGKIEPPRVLELAGAAEVRLKEYVLAEALLARALKAEPRRLLVRQLLAQAYMRSGQSAKALEVLRPVIDSPEADGATLSLAGEAYLQLGDNKNSEAAFQRALKVAPGDARVRTSAALAQIWRGEGGAAIPALEALAAGGEGGARADLALISARLSQRDLPGALKAIDALEKKMPEQGLPLHLRGRVLAQQGNLAGAAKSFEAALAKEPGYFPAAGSLVALDLKNNKPDAARARLQEFLKSQPKSAPAMLALAELDARSGAPGANVLATLREAAKLNPSQPGPHMVLINRLLAIGDAKGALQAAQDAAAALPNNLDIMALQGRAEGAAGDGQRAVSTFKKLAALEPKNPQPLVLLAEAYLLLQDRSAATLELKRAIELLPDGLPARRRLAQLAVQDKRPQDALALARELQTRKPTDAGGFTLEGEIEANRKGFDASIAAFRAALQRNAGTDVAVSLHSVYLAAGKGADAERMATDWQKDHPKDAAFTYHLGDVAMAGGDLAAAQIQYQRVLEIQPDNALAMNNVAWLLLQQGKPGALPFAQKAAALMPERAAVQDTLSMALEAGNELPKAIEVQQRAIALAPQEGALTLRLAKLYIKQGEKARARAELETLAKQGDRFTGQAEVAALLKTL